MKRILLLFILLASMHVQAQLEVQKSSIDNGGAIVHTSSLSMLSTVGEVFVRESSVPSLLLSEGFISTDFVLSLGLDSFDKLTDIRIYPNPATDYVFVQKPADKKLEVSLYDLAGKYIPVESIQNEDYIRLKMGHLANAVYWLLVIDKDSKQYATHKIVKH